MSLRPYQHHFKSITTALFEKAMQLCKILGHSLRKVSLRCCTSFSKVRAEARSTSVDALIAVKSTLTNPHVRTCVRGRRHCIIAERISARQYNLFSGYMYIRTYVRTFGHLRRRVRVGVACAWLRRVRARAYTVINNIHTTI